MKRLGIGNILKWFLVICAIIVAIPPVINLACEMLNTYTKLNFDWRVEWSSWSDLIAVAILSALTCFVIKQSEEQQKANDESQERMERINQRMVDMELKSSIGYFVPPLNKGQSTQQNGVVFPYKHDLKKYIDLDNIGNDDVFVISVAVRVNGKECLESTEKPLYISKLAPYNALKIELKLTVEELRKGQIDTEIEIKMKNTKGYIYAQVLYIGFENRNGIGTVDSFNMEIKEIEENAH